MADKEDQPADLAPAVVTCVTYNNLHFTLNLIKSIHATWRSRPRIVVALADHFTLDRPGFADLADVEFLSLDELEIPNLGWLLCKCTPFEVCALAKSFALRKVMALGAKAVCYVDSDVHFFADIQPFYDELGDDDFLVTPHLMSPLPLSEPWSRVTMGEVTAAGVLNSGLFVARNTPGAHAFLETWGKLCVMPGAFLSEMGSQTEQQFFNWIYSFSDKVALSRNPRANIAYWNLHERPIRWGGLDDADKETWRLGEEPIVCFHFSGFAWDQKRLSRHDHRIRPYMNANVFAICEFYTRRLAASEQAHYSAVPYEFGKVDRLELDDLVRIELKRSEMRGTPACETWASAGPVALRRLNETLSPFHVVPRYLEPVLLRTDLAPFFDPIFAPRWHYWADVALWRDHERFADFYEKFSSFVFRRDALAHLTENVGKAVPAMDAAEIVDLLRNDRPLLIRRLAARPVPAETTQAIEGATYRYPAFAPAIALRLIYMKSPELQSRFPRIAGADSQAFKTWLTTEFSQTFEAPEAVLRFVAGFDFERSVARIIGKCMRIPHIAEAIRRDGFSRAHLPSLLPGSQGGHGFDPSDIVVFDWWLEQMGSDAQRRVAELLPPEAGDDGFRRYLAAWCHGRGIVEVTTPEEVTRAGVGALDAFLQHMETAGRAAAGSPGNGAQVAAFEKRAEGGKVLLRVGDAVVQAKLRQALEPDPRGINIFGYFNSPTGIGTATHGLCRALEVAGYPQRKLTIPSDPMDADVEGADLFQDFGFNYPRNMVVTYPHIDYQLQSVRPRCFFSGRETIGYLAWEQRDFPVAWRERLAPYDRLCALSRFAAESIARGVDRNCNVLPCVVEVGAPVPKDAARARFGIPAGKFVVGFMFDAASSIERKNPWGAIDAVKKAFGHSDDVFLVLKVGSGERPDFGPRMAEIRRRVASLRGGAMIVTDYLPRRDVETLVCAFDVYLSLHRSEGFGYTLAEAMLLGVPTVASRYSGNLDFMTDENSYLIDCREVVLQSREGPFETGTIWADPSLDHAVETLRRIRNDYPKAAARARASAAGVADVVSAAAVAKTAARIIEAPA